MSILEIISIILILGGLFFFFTATVGLIRMPDYYCRMQATGKGDTLGAVLCLSGLALYNLDSGLSFANIIVSIKIMFIAIFIFIANPTATHAISKAGIDCEVKPWTKKKEVQS
ncbi:MAG: monovalent cation/H(+) antiporter subunit G [Thermodesulfovibrionales bacterium]|nr:monovalent cation/H(+) antiporter subunit G [Thermodesulfovibrionales bacterium]